MEQTKTPGAIKRIVPMEVLLLEYVNGEYRDEKALIVAESGFMDMSPDDPELKNKLRVLDLYKNPPGEWRSSGKVTKWLAQAIHKQMKDNVSVNNEVENS